MSHFRAINVPSPGPESRQLSPKVVLPATQSHASRSSLSAGKADVGQAVTKEHKAVHSSKKKNKKSNSAVSKASRQQAPREKKIMYSIEQSAQKRAPSPTPLHELKDGDYLPTAAELAETILSTAQSTPSQRIPREQASTRRNTRPLAFPKARPRTSALQPSPQAACPLAIPKMDSSAAGCNSPDPELGLEPKSTSPSLWISQVRKERYEQAGLVELPKEVFEYLSSKKAKKRIEQQLAEKRKDMKEGKRKEKGKFAEQRPVNESDEPNQRDQSEKKMGKKREREDTEHEPRKRQHLQKSSKSHEPGLENHGNESQHFDGDTASKQKSARNSTKHKSVERKAQRHKVSVIKTEGSKTMKWHPLDLEVPEEGSRPFDDPALRSREQQGAPRNEDWRKPFQRREVRLGEGRTCSCKRLPDFFTRNPYDVPCLATWHATGRGGDREFFKHVKQISCCQGSVHPLYVINACRKMLEERLCSNRGDTGSVVDSAQGILSTKVSDDHSMRRAQSSIPPPVFYGSGDSSQQAPHRRSFSHFMPEMGKATSSLGPLAISKPSNGIFVSSAQRNAPAKHDGFKRSRNHADRPVDQLTTPDAAREPNNHPARPNPSVRGKPQRGHMPTFDIYDEVIPEEETVGKEKTSSTLPEVCSQARNSFNAKRQRHRSVPANLPSRKPTVDELSLSPLPEPQRREGVLQEIYNHALLQNMNKTLAPIKKCLKDLTDRLLPPPPAQTAPAAPASAPPPAAIPNAAPQPGGNNAELPNGRKRHRKPVAERKRNLPELSRDVPAHLRLPDADLVAIGRKSNHYERHAAAPYAFTWRGRLLAEYDYLLRWGGDGWTAKEIKRVTG